MTLTSKERSAMQVVLWRLYKKNHYKTNIIEFYEELEKSNSLNLDEINNILHYVKNATPEELYKSLVIEIKARQKLKKRTQKKYRDMTEEERAKHREVARRYAKRHYKSKKGTNNDD